MTDEEYKRKKFLLERQREKLLCEKSYKEFVRSAWDVLEPQNTLEWNWHYDVLCDEMQKQIERIANKEPRQYHLCINIPPRSLKSMIFTRLPAAWAWIKYPHMRFIRSSYAEELAIEHAVETRTVIESRWYQRNWGSIYRLKPDQNNKSHFRTTFNGAVITTSTGAKVAGRGGDIVSHDDPISPEQAESETELKKHIRFHNRTMRSRLNNEQVGMFIIVMQRLSIGDLTGWVKENEAEKWKFICLPVEEAAWISPPELRKFYVNGLFFPKRFPQSFCDEKRKDSYVFAGQYMQLPTPEEGGIFKRKDVVFWQKPGMHLPPVTVRVGMETLECELVYLPKTFEDMIDSWDFAFENKKTSDFVSGHTIATSGARTYFLDEVHDRMTFGQSCNALVAQKKKWPMTSRICIEKKANGHAIIQEYIETIPGIKAIEANKGDNTFSKANIMSKAWESHNIVLPHPLLAPWVNKFIEEYIGYTGLPGIHDDRVSSGAQGFVELKTKPVFPMYRNKLIALNIKWKELETSTGFYISEYVESDSLTSIVIALWNQRLGRLVIFDEIVMLSPLPQWLKPIIESKVINASGGAIMNLSRFEWYGNALMFGRSGEGSARQTLMKDGMQEAYLRENINLIDTPGFNEPGAILNTAMMMLKNKVIVDQHAPECGRQLQAWYYEGTAPASGHGLARAAILLASNLYESGKSDKTAKRYKEFSQEKMGMLENLKRMDQLGSIGSGIEGEAAGVGAKNSWMGN